MKKIIELKRGVSLCFYSLSLLIFSCIIAVAALTADQHSLLSALVPVSLILAFVALALGSEGVTRIHEFIDANFSQETGDEEPTTETTAA